MTPLIDLHCDTLYRLANVPERFFLPQKSAASHLFYEGLLSSGSLLQCFAMFTDLCDPSYPTPLSSVRSQYDTFRRILALSKGKMVQVQNKSELLACKKDKKIGALLTMEESCLSPAPVSLLPAFRSMGVRMATLTWDYHNLLATAANHTIPLSTPKISSLSSGLLQPVSKHPGLSPSGIDYVCEAERFGILIDVSHLSDASFYDVARHSQKPFLASHSNARTVWNVPRNLSDAMLRIIASRGGIVGLNLHEPFLGPSPSSPEQVLSFLVQHVKHILSVAGSDTPALGTDFDGTPGNAAIPDVTFLYRFEHALRHSGFSSYQIEKIFYKNAFRFFRENL